MAVTSRHSIFPASFVYAGPTTLNLRQLISVDHKSGTNKETVIPGGAIDPSAIILNFADPRQMLGTHDFAGVLGGVSITAGLNCTGGYTIRYQTRADGSTFATGGAHVTLTGGRSFLMIDSISADQDTPARMDLEHVPLWDETLSGNQPVPPVVATASVDFAAAPTPTFNSMYWLGPVVIGSTELEGIVSTRVSPGINFDVKRSSGQIWAPHGAIIERKPTVTLEVLKTNYVATMNQLFNKDAADAIKLYYPKGVHGGARVAANSNVHGLITVSTGAWNPEQISVQHPNDTTVTIEIQATGTISASVASALP